MNFANYVDGAARETPGKTAVTDSSRSLTFGELAEAADRVAGVLQARDVGGEDHVAIRMMDEDGFLYVVDRLEDMFTTGYGDIYPREIEEVIYGIDPVENVAIVDTRNEVRGATVTAVVKLRAGESVSADDIRAVCQRELESHEIPDRVGFVDELPRTTTGKLDRVTLRERFR